MFWQTLRWRLFLSFVMVLAITLAVAGAALFIIFNTRAAPVEPTLERLANFAVNINLRELAREANFRLVGPNESDYDDLVTVLTATSTEYDVRMLLLNMSQRRVLFDSAGQYQRGDALNGESRAYRVPAALTSRLYAEVDAVAGSFNDADSQKEWLFVGVEGMRPELRDPSNALGGARSSLALVYAEERPTQNLGAALNDFGAELFPLLAQVAFVGVVVALIAAGLLARSVASPLQTLATAAGDIANGHYGQQVSVTGPHEVRALADSFNRMSHQVLATQQAQNDFMANVSHDLKTPLTSIQGFSGAIIDGTAPDTAKAARIIHQEAERLDRMVAELTDLARLQAGQFSMKLSSINLARLCESVAQRLSVIANEKNIALTIEPPPPDTIVSGDGDRLVQVVTNLIGNAIKYTPAGGQVWVATRREQEGVVLAVRDTGVGIPMPDQERIFERFYQVDRARGPKRGTGLGLAIAKEIVTAHGGTISVTSAGEGQGSTFTVWLPTPDRPTIVRRRAS